MKTLPEAQTVAFERLAEVPIQETERKKIISIFGGDCELCGKRRNLLGPMFIDGKRTDYEKVCSDCVELYIADRLAELSGDFRAWWKKARIGHPSA